jgi:hypothetical protein
MANKRLLAQVWSDPSTNSGPCLRATARRPSQNRPGLSSDAAETGETGKHGKERKTGLFGRFSRYSSKRRFGETAQVAPFAPQGESPEEWQTCGRFPFNMRGVGHDETNTTSLV